jgi:hypothetical protein
VIVCGAPGTDREHVVVRDSDPRIGDRSLFELPVAEWPGRALEVATMTTSTIESVAPEADPIAIAAVGIDGKVARNPWARPDGAPAAPAAAGPSGAMPPLPAGVSESPAIVPLNVRGTTPAVDPIVRAIPPEEAHKHQLAKQVVVGAPSAAAPPAEVPYPLRHVTYAESIVQLLRSIVRRDKIFDDLGGNRELRDRLRRALDESVTLLEQIRRRDRK